jgi:fucose permease
MFWPSAMSRGFGGFCRFLILVGSGLSTLETSDNFFIVTCDPPHLSEFRLKLPQSFQAIGPVKAPLLASRVLFSHTGPNYLSKVQWAYLGITASVPSQKLQVQIWRYRPSSALALLDMLISR